MLDNNKFDDDDYVAKLLAEDAKKSSHRYAAVGLSALLPQRPIKAAAKPNTRFLSHIVREADSHNAALKKKEELEARIRLRKMKDSDQHHRDRHDVDGRVRKRRRVDSDDDRTRRSHMKSRDSRRSPSPRREERSRRHDHREIEHRRGDDERSRRRSHHTSGRSHKSHRRRSPSQGSGSDRSRPRRPRTSQSAPRPKSVESVGSESDPLEELVGPLPRASQSSKSLAPVRIRGRGAHSAAKLGIDARFSATYDPALDVHPDDELTDEREDWDMALEALRDRAMWKRKQTDRMKEAGFGDEDIRKWEKSAIHGALGDGSPATGEGTNVKWAKKGETREWDVGKRGFND